MDMTIMSGFRVLDIRDCVARLIKAGRTEEQANAEVDVILGINEASSATKEEVREVDRRVDMVEVKLDALSDKVDRIETKLSWVIGLILSAIVALTYTIFEYLPVIVRLIELKNSNL